MIEKVLITKSKLDTLAEKIIVKAESSGKKTIDELGELIDNFQSNTSDMLQARVDSTNDCSYLFYNFAGPNVNFIANLNTSKVTSMEYIFYSNKKITTIPQLDTSNVTTIRYAFYNNQKLANLQKLNTNKVTDFRYTFSNCYVLKNIDLSYYKISSVTFCSYTFQNCYSLKALVIRSFGSYYELNSNAFNNCYHILGTTNATYNPDGLKDGYIYVPRDMLVVLKDKTNWSVHASQLRVLEDYTVDGTVNGDLDEEKVSQGGNSEMPSGSYNLSFVTYTEIYSPTSFMYSLDNGATWNDFADLFNDGDYANPVLTGIYQIKFQIRPGFEFVCEELGINISDINEEMIVTENYILTENINVYMWS